MPRGWPKGKPRKPQIEAPMTAEDGSTPTRPPEEPKEERKTESQSAVTAPPEERSAKQGGFSSRDRATEGSEETAEGPPEQEEGTFNWDDEKPKEKAEAPSSIPPFDAAGLADVVAGVIGNLHHQAALVTNWNGWELDPQELETWKAVLRPLLASLDPRKWGLALALLALLVMEGGKVARFIAWRRPRKAEPLPPKSGGKAAAPKNQVGTDYVPITAPMEHAQGDV